VSVTRADVERIAELARLELGEQELGRLTSELNGILGHIGQLASLDLAATSDLTPQIRSPLPATRPEGAEEADVLRQSPASFAPDWREGFFVVPPPPGVHREPSE
jgi:aspartyl-tRNA(Asn)/glutamyl-tRNA(Gln) amidotransferase subunit C